MPAGDGPDGVGHSQDGEPEGEGDAEQADADVGAAVRDDLGGEHGGAAAAEDEDEGAQRFRGEP